MKEAARIVIPVKVNRSIRSLCWDGDELVDWVGGGVRYKLDGSSSDPQVYYAYKFDRAISSPDGRYAVIYEELGTKGLLLKEGKILREINRSFYQAGAYEYPVLLFKLPDGTDVIAHCPENYRNLEIDELESGKRLTRREGAAVDFFHSRLQVSPNSGYLLSAGWVWHPLDKIQVYDLQQALANPTTLDRNESRFPVEMAGLDEMHEIHSAAFIDDEAILVAGEIYESESNFLGIYRPSENRLTSRVALEQPVGTLMPVGDFAVSFFQHPKLIEVATGQIVRRWPEIDSGRQNSSILVSAGKAPPIAIDAANRRFAVATTGAIIAIQLG